MGLFEFPKEVFVYKVAFDTGKNSIFFTCVWLFEGMDVVRGHKLHSALHVSESFQGQMTPAFELQ